MAKTMFEPTGACERNAADNSSSSATKSCTEPAHFRQTPLSPRRCGGRSAISFSSAGKTIRRAGGLDRTAESHQPNGVGAEDEKNTRACKRNNR